MNKRELNIGWQLFLDFWRKARIAVFILIIAYGGLFSLMIHEFGPYKFFNPRFGFFYFLFSLSFPCIALIPQNTRKGQEIAFNGRLFQLPLRTWKMVFWQMISPMIAVTFVCAVTSLIIALSSGSHYPWPAQALVYCVMIAAGLAILWSIQESILLRLVVFGVIESLLVNYLVLEFEEQWYVLTIGKCFESLLLILCFYAIAVAGVARDRRGDAQPWTWPAEIWEHWLGRSKTRGKDLRNPAAAQFWLEWRRKGHLLPAAALFFFLTFALTWSYFALRHQISAHDHAEFLSAYAWNCFFTIILISVPFGLYMGQVHSMRRSDMGSFFSTLPITDAQFSRAFLKTGAGALFIGWATNLLLLGFVAILFIIAGCGYVVTDVIQDFLHLRKEDFLLIKVIVIVLIAWAAISTSICMTLAGRVFVTWFPGALILTVLFAWMFLGIDFPDSDLIRLFAKSLPWIFSISSLGYCLYLYFRAIYSGHISPGWAILALLPIFYIIGVYYKVPNMEVQGVLTSRVLWLVSLAVAPFAAAPLAISHNRHR
mgnify:CR=1 FL=1